ncbi:MAG: InlB B-repeat-containing protein [Clostridiales Family XIII bacterium]|nr:InlB B-repeat-containing protein [Clostridiales Family XIII bacterium]
MNLTGNLARNYTDMEWKAPGFNVVVGRTYNSQDDRDAAKGNIMSKGWTFSFQGRMEDENGVAVVRLPNGSGLTFEQNKTTGAYKARDSRAALAKNGDGHLLTTADNYSYSFNDKGFMTSMRDPYGNAVTITLDASGRPVAVTDQAGRSAAVGYGTSDRINSVTDPAGRVTAYAYDAEGRLSKATAPDGSYVSYGYDAEGRLNKISDQAGTPLEQIIYEDIAGEAARVTSVTDIHGDKRAYVYDKGEGSVTVTDSNGRTEATWYDTALYPVRTKDAEGRETYAEYALESGLNRYGEIRMSIDGYGNVTSYDRDERGNVTRVINPDGSARELTYNSKNNVLAEKDESGRATFREYAADGVTLLRIARPLNGTDVWSPSANQGDFSVTGYAYYSAAETQNMLGRAMHGLLKTETGPEGGVTAYTYDQRGSLASVTGPRGSVTAYESNVLGWKKTETNSKGTTTWHYDKAGNVLRTVYPDGGAERTLYDFRGNAAQRVMPNQYAAASDALAVSGENILSGANAYGAAAHGYRYEYDSRGMKTKEIDPLGHVTAYAYDMYGNLTKEVRPDGSAWRYSYDVMNRVKREEFSDTEDGAVRTLAERSYGQAAGGGRYEERTAWLAAGVKAVTRDVYDHAGRLTRTDDPMGNSVERTYFGDGLLKSERDGRGNVTRYAYDGLGLLSGKWTPYEGAQHIYQGYEHDRAGRLTRETGSRNYAALNAVPTSGQAWTSYAYYPDGLVSMKETSGGRKTEYAYDAMGNLTQTKEYYGAAGYNRTDRTYDFRGLTLTETRIVAASDLEAGGTGDRSLTTSYERDKSGNVTSETLPDGTRTTYGLDLLGRSLTMTRTKAGRSRTLSYSYDFAGNVLSETDALGRTASHVYDKQGFLVKTADALGGVRLYGRDWGGRLTYEISPRNYIGETAYDISASVRTLYEYDLLGRLTAKKEHYLTPAGAWKTAVIQRNEYDAAGNLSRSADAVQAVGGAYAQYAYDNANRLLSTRTPKEKNGSQITYDEASRTLDGLSNVLTETDANGNTTAFTYDDDGNRLTEAKAGVTVSRAWDKLGNKIMETDGNGNATYYAWNALGRLRVVTYPAIAYPAVTMAPASDDPDEYSERSCTVSYDANGGTGAPQPQTKQHGTPLTLSATAPAREGHGFLGWATSASATAAEWQPGGIYEADASVTLYAVWELDYDGPDYEVKAAFSGGAVMGTFTNHTGSPVSVILIIAAYRANGVMVASYANPSVAPAGGSVGASMPKNAEAALYKVFGWSPNFVPLCSAAELHAESDRAEAPAAKIMLAPSTPAPKTAVQDFAPAETPGPAAPLAAPLAAPTGARPYATRHAYTPLGQPATETDSMGRTRRTSYDFLGNVVSESEGRADGSETITRTYERDLMGNMTKATDGVGAVTTYGYDRLNRLTGSAITVRDAEGVATVHTTARTYDADGNLLTEKDWRGNAWTYVYDPIGRLIERRDPNGTTVETLGYDDGNLQTSSKDALNRVKTFTYDLKGRIIKETDALGRHRAKTYDGMGNVTASADGNGNVTEYGYDAFGNLLAVTDALGQITSYSYDGAGNMTSMTDAGGNVTGYYYTSRNQLAYKSAPGGALPDGRLRPSKTERHEYLDNGLLSAKTDRNGITATYAYDVHGRLLTETAGGAVRAYSYDANGNTLTAATAGRTVTRRYDALGRVISKQATGAAAATYSYDSVSGLAAGFTREIAVDPKGNVTTRVFDKAGRLASLGGTGAGTITYSYYANGAKQKITYPGGVTAEYAYHDDGRLKTLANKRGGTILEAYAYAYDGEGNMTAKTDAKGVTAYTYDALNRLEAVTEPSGRLTAYAYDGAGNRLTEEVTENGATVVTTYSYNEENRLTGTDAGGAGASYAYDKNGNTTRQRTGGGAADFAYDQWNQLASASDPAGVGTGAAYGATYSYDAEGLRIRKSVTQGGATEVTGYFHEYSHVVLETDGEGAETGRSIYGDDVLMARKAGGATLYYLYNGHGDVTALVDGNGSIAASYYYDAFGNIMEETGAAAASNSVRYAGYRYDEESGLYYLNARYYDPVTSRMLSEDTFRGFQNEPLSLNLYTYCYNNPLIYWDPTGHWAVGDEKYDAKTQEAIAKATSDYYAATTQAGRDQAHAAAEAARASGTQSSTAQTSWGSSYTQGINDSASGYYTADSWGGVVTREAAKAATTLSNTYSGAYSNNNPALLLKGDGPTQTQYALLYNYNYLRQQSGGKLTNQILASKDNYRPLTPDEELALKFWYVYTGTQTLEDELNLQSKLTDPIYLDVNRNTVNIYAHLAIRGNGADVASQDPNGGTATYRELVIQGINGEWSGDYWMNGRWVTVNMNAVDYNDGQSRIYDAKQKFVDVEIVNKAGRGNVHWGLSWSTTKVGKMTLYTTDEGWTTPMSVSRFKYVAAHELGHNMGLGDAYEKDGYFFGLFGSRNEPPLNAVNKNDLMWVSEGTASVVDLSMIFQSHSTGKVQEFPQKQVNK